MPKPYSDVSGVLTEMQQFRVAEAIRAYQEGSADGSPAAAQA